MSIQIEWIPPEELIPYEKNPRKNDKAVDVVATSISQYGFLVPIILDKDNIIIAGHTRLKAAKKLGLKEVPVIWAENLTPAQIKGFRIMDNKSNEYAKWDLESLKIEFQELKDLNFDLSLTGFKEAQIDTILQEGADEQFYKKEPKYKIQEGDVYQLGDHRIICGDATKRNVHSALIQGNRVACVFTDPPYGVSYVRVNNPNGRKWEMIENDDLRGDSLYNLLFETFQLIQENLKTQGSLYVFHASANQIIFEKALNKAGFKVKQQLIWQKHLVLGHSHYHWAHEPMFYCCRENEDPLFYGDRVDKTMLNKIEPDKMSEKELREFVKRTIEESTIWQVQKDNTTEYIHPTQKPTKLAKRAIINSTNKGEYVLDTFGGSGSTLMACEEEGRKALIIEMDPIYVSHIIERWENSTGKKGVKV